MAPVETEFYDLLGVPVDVKDVDLKKAYRKQAIKYHPDKNPSPDAEEKFKDISKAYQVLSDPNLRAVYDRNGAKMVDKEGGVSMDDAAGFFANVFGGDRFNDYIGEISLMKEMTSVATTMMTEEERADLETQMNEGVTPTPPSGVTHAPTPAAEPTATAPAAATAPADAPIAPKPQHPPTNGASHLHVATPGSLSPSPSTPTNTHEGNKSPTPKGKGKSKLTPEQRKKLQELEDERRENMKQRVETLKAKLIERIRPFVEAKHPGDKDDPETKAFQAKMKREADDLKLESFGVELLHTIGNVYMMKATSYLKSKKFLGIPGFFSRLKEKGAIAKDAWGVIGSAIGVQNLMQEMERLQAKGEVAEEELRALEEDVTGKIMLASWRGTRFEVVQVLREVVDGVLKEQGVSDVVLYNRAKALLITGAIFKATVPDESDEERRELERMVAEAAAGKSKHSQLQAQARAAAKAKQKEGHAHGTIHATSPAKEHGATAAGPAGSTTEKVHS
ncbi:DnaJ-domain-containing protein [Cristinia sonorae]|uniref:DnaJ-domain-containing protein n=1 Tax=Cristinia sonorae TaxID=1940300 RepID=A0A8K0UKM4_9AGAR|nr:DnaJ-domain-containing protein [Cristinia sonorae]